jgi:glutathione S-transferase
MITLYAAGPGFGLPEFSPYGMKAEVQLKLAGLAYAKEKARPTDGPKGQLPWIDDRGTLVGDTTFIRAHLEERYAIDLDAGLDAAARAQAWAVERMIENHLSWVSAWTRFCIPDNFEVGPAHFFDDAPQAMRKRMQRDLLLQVSANLRAVGIARHAPGEIAWLGDRSIEALAALLADKPYLFGDKPCGTDATAFAMLAGILTSFFDSPLRRTAEAHDNLVAYVGRMMATHYPRFAWWARSEAA